MSTVDLNPNRSKGMIRMIIPGFKFALISGCLVGITLYGLLLMIGIIVSVHIIPLTVLYFVCFIIAYIIGTSLGYDAGRRKYLKSIS